MNETCYHFIPAVRRGLAAAIAEEANGERAELTVRLYATASGDNVVTERVDTRVQLYGPGDILGFDSRIVTRTDPRANVGDFEPNYFPMIEFADPDFPWRYSAAAGDATGLRPWIALIVLEPGEFDEEDYRKSTGNPSNPEVPWIKVKVSDAGTLPLPDLNEAWRWAHVQVTAEKDLTLDETSFEDFDAATPERIVSRLLCGRRLKPGTAYEAFVVPTFKLGCVAANRAVLQSGETALTLAWEKSPPGEAALPYYYRWKFHTGLRGDFEYLVRLLEPRNLTDLGRRPMDCSAPGYGLPAVERPEHVLDLEGALKSVGLEYTQWGADNPPGDPTLFQQQLAANLLNLPYDGLSNSGKTPLVVPPIYGRWHAGRFKVRTNPGAWVRGEWTRSDTYPWIDELNLDPRHRASSGFGALVIERQQEALMASAWDQLGQIEEANEILRRAQLGREAAAMIFRRLDALSLRDFLRATKAVHGRIGFNGTTVGEHLAQSPIPGAAFDPALRRIMRARGPFRRRQRPPDHNARDMLDRLNDGSLRAAGPAPKPDRMLGVCDVTKATSPQTPQPPPQPPSPGTNSFINPTLALSPTNIRLSWPAVVGRNYYVEGKANLTVPDWTSLSPTNVATSTSMTYYIDRPTDYAFFQVVELAGISPSPLPPIDQPGDGGGVKPPGHGGVKPLGDGGGGTPVPEPTKGRFCEPFITCAEIQAALNDPKTLNGLSLPTGVTLSELNSVLCGDNGVLNGWLKITPSPSKPMPPANLDEIIKVLKEALDPRTTIARRVKKRLRLAQDVGSDELSPAMASPDFPQPMYEPLRDISQDLVLPGVERVPQNTLAFLETNGRFVESYMVGLNHAFTGELFWRGAPVGGQATYFRQFWDVNDYVPTANELDELLKRFLEARGANTVSNLAIEEKRRVLERHKLTREELDKLLTTFLTKRSVKSVSELQADERERVLRRYWPTAWDTSEMDATEINLLVETLLTEELLAEKLKDIKRISEWRGTSLGTHDNRAPDKGEQLVLLVRGDLLRKYPNTVVYAVPAVSTATNRNPGLAEFPPNQVREQLFPVFSGTLPPDLYFFGFPFSAKEALGQPDGEGPPRFPIGVYFVLEERVSEARFGMDEAGDKTSPTSWDQLNWAHMDIKEGDHIDAAAPVSNLIPAWDTSSAAIAYITVQKPVRIAVHAEEMLPKPPAAA